MIGGRPQSTPDAKLIKVIAQARHWYQQLRTGQMISIQDIATDENVFRSEISRVLPLAFLAPNIVSDILAGRQPIDLTAKILSRKTANLPTNWDEQRRYLGFAA